ncbi:hypothetical protein BDB01DRAFT_716247 [Pilobolus umbonatus]|nr:hypothetical protein BDB01DRAFT_716247 [Pilobolus umbonatus]
MPESPPYLNYRCGLAIDSTFYLPFIHDNSHCYSYNLKSGVWTIHKLNLIGTTTIDPQITRAAAVGSKIYLMGGRLLKKYVLSNTLIEMDTNTFDTRIIQNTTGTPPRPRHEHSVEVIQDRYLVVFGGLCYNSAGENDVFVFDILHNHWFVPPITGHVPHMRFGHASAVIGTDMYIHGGAQIDNVNRYIVYDDLYKLDCKTWVWYKYENPEVERYLRNQGQAEGEAPRKDYLIATTGCNPYDRFQSYICTNGNKLFIFGGHTIREDEYDNDVILSYPLDEITVFNTKRCCWSNNHLSSKGNSIQDDNPLIVSDISAAKVFSDAPILSIFIIAERNMPGALSLGNQPNESRVISSSSTNSGSSGNSSTQPQPGIFPADEDIEPLKVIFFSFHC